VRDATGALVSARELGAVGALAHLALALRL
jgi:hypothetical protein